MMNADFDDGSEENAGHDRRSFLKSAAGVSAVGLLAGANTSSASQVGAGNTSQHQGFLLPYDENDPELGREFLDDPQAFLRKRNMTEDGIACPAEVHDTFRVCDRMRDELQSRIKDGTVKTPLELSRAAEEMVKERFGDDFKAVIQPFGMRFQQRSPIYDNTVGFTITGTVSITWLDSDADVDG
jgi:hypothetical protein